MSGERIEYVFNGRKVSLRLRETTQRIVVHHSASTFGDAGEIDNWHRNRPEPFLMVGYHFIVLNGYRRKTSRWDATADGLVELGRPVNTIGAHAADANLDSIGICVIGRGPWFSINQISALHALVRSLFDDYPHIGRADVYGHRQVGTTSTLCPGFEIERLRGILRVDPPTIEFRHRF